MYFAIKSTPKVSVSNFWGAVQGLPLFFGIVQSRICQGLSRVYQDVLHHHVANLNS
ncbi:hypothetical protein [Moraxella lacunata]|uniref:hypothetical protein n=1 Tax=Moraxella lacunata TaxID=477 RepID=UPI003EE040D2